jgi:DedD protein
MADSSDANLQLKKRARRRLVGAIAFAGLAAVVLPMVMDEEPKQQVQDVQIRIPSQDPAPLAAQPAKAPAPAASAEKPAAPAEAAAPAAPASEGKPAVVPVSKAPEKNPAKNGDKPEKATEAPAKASVSEPQRAAAILGGKTVEAAPAANGGDGQYLILIGAFSNPANVKQLQTKIGELGIKVYTETLESPEGKKTRVRAGPFPNREAADRALEKMKRIGVNGLVAAKQ